MFAQLLAILLYYDLIAALDVPVILTSSAAHLICLDVPETPSEQGQKVLQSPLRKHKISRHFEVDVRTTTRNPPLL